MQAQISSGVMRANTELAVMVSAASDPMTGETGPPGWVAAMTLPILVTISRGSRGLPVAWAGHTLVQRPQMVQVSVSSSCFQVKSSMALAPKLSSDGLGQVRQRLHRALGPVPVAQVHVHRRGEHVAQLGGRAPRSRR